ISPSQIHRKDDFPTDRTGAYLKVNYNHTFSPHAQTEFTSTMMDLLACCSHVLLAPAIGTRTGAASYAYDAEREAI
ncbi:MAG: hypothetical protein WA603_16980, partial [Candidatus Acidiferrales bacterium]